MNDNEALAVAHQVLEYVERLQSAGKVPAIPERFADDAAFLNYHKKIVEMRGFLAALSGGDLSVPMTARGFIAGCCKAVQANLRHMVWMVDQVEAGDYEQHIDFLGDLATSFNRMDERLKKTTEALLQKEEALTELAVSLQKEARKRSEVLQELKKSEQRFKYLAQHDPLTNLLNRRSFFAFAERALKSAFALREPTCVCLLDVDDFKKFNDTFGHLEGDRALQHVVMHSLNALRQTDIMGRYGGEEFIFLLTNMGEGHGYAAADRIRLAVERCVFPLENGDTAHITASIGVAVILPDKKTDDYAAVLRLGVAQADAALYKAKTEGKNRVCLTR